MDRIFGGEAGAGYRKSWIVTRDSIQSTFPAVAPGYGNVIGQPGTIMIFFPCSYATWFHRSTLVYSYQETNTTFAGHQHYKINARFSYYIHQQSRYFTS